MLEVEQAFWGMAIRKAVGSGRAFIGFHQAFYLNGDRVLFRNFYVVNRNVRSSWSSALTGSRGRNQSHHTPASLTPQKPTTPSTANCSDRCSSTSVCPPRCLRVSASSHRHKSACAGGRWDVLRLVRCGKGTPAGVQSGTIVVQ